MATFYYGHGSWLFVVVFIAFFVMRILPARRRQHGRQGPPAGAPAPTSSFTEATSQGRPPDAADASSGKVTFTGIAPGWLVDPTGRHEHRYWSGSAWTEHVTDGGIPATDPPPGSGRAAS